MHRMRSLFIVLIGFVAGSSLGFSDESVSLPDGTNLKRVDFRRHLAPLLTQLGCNSASCHGASDGQGGFRLSLFGYDSDFDHASITAADSGRVDSGDVDESLLLTKPSMLTDHDGGRRFERDSWEFRLIRSWIAQGARLSAKSSLEKLSLELTSSVLTPSRPNLAFKVLAYFQGEKPRDVTAFATIRVMDESVGKLIGSHSVHRVSSGDTAIVATYGGLSTNAPILVPFAVADANPGVTGGVPSPTTLDGFVERKLARLGIPASQPTTDETFLRRVFLTTIGQLPRPDEIRAFVMDTRPDKREVTIDRLLSHPLHNSIWATRMCEMTGSRDVMMRGLRDDSQRQEQWHAWFEKQFADDVGYDRIVHNILCSSTRQNATAETFVQKTMLHAEIGQLGRPEVYAERETFDLFWQRLLQNEQIDLESTTERVAAAFLGVRIECARCHKHPFDRWTQNDHRSLMNVFSRLRVGISPKLRSALVDTLQTERERREQGLQVRRVPKMVEVFESDVWQDRRDANNEMPLPAKALGGPEFADEDRREAFAGWLLASDNEFFAPNMVNRVWAMHFGRGLVEPVDAFSASNPPTHPDLLTFLAQRFVDGGFSIRALEREILVSRAWQRSSIANGANRNDRRNHSHFSPRMLRAAQVVDAIGQAIGDQRQPIATLATWKSADQSVNDYFSVFDRPERESVCDCERNPNPTLRQTMLLMSDPKLLERIRGGFVKQISESNLPIEEMVDEIFLRTVSRWPNPEERSGSLDAIGVHTDPLTGLCDVMWSLINTREFITNH